jgi:putative membrane protein
MIGLKMLLVWLIPLGLVFALVIYLTNQSRATSYPETAISLLERAYARGDIGREEFLQKREDILGTNKITP